MSEHQVFQALDNPDATLDELVGSLYDMAIQYGYIARMAVHGLRQNAETDLVRVLCIVKCIVKIIKLRIHNKVQLLTKSNAY